MPLDDHAWVQCPYCHEQVGLTLDVCDEGEMVLDCTVCCRPWRIWARWRRGRLVIAVEPA